MAVSQQPGPVLYPASYEIQPTAPLGTITREDRYTDISLSNLLGAHVAQINSVRQAIWARYTAMLIANSVLSGLLGRAETIFQKAGGAAIGIFLCVAWISMLIRDWRLFNALMQEASKFVWTLFGPAANPFTFLLETEGQRLGLTIYVLAGFVASSFLLLHTVTLVPSIWPDWWPVVVQWWKTH